MRGPAGGWVAACEEGSTSQVANRNDEIDGGDGCDESVARARLWLEEVLRSVRAELSHTIKCTLKNATNINNVRASTNIPLNLAHSFPTMCLKNYILKVL